MTIKYITPILYASDFERSMAYFVDQLGFKRLWDWGKPPRFGAVGRDEVELFLCLDGQGKSGTWMSVFVDDVDALFRDFTSRGARIPQAPKDMPWGMREMHVECPDDHILRFGHGIPCAPERIVERRELAVRIESRLASVLEDLAQTSGRSVGQLLEDVVLHSFEAVPGKEGVSSASAYPAGFFHDIEALKKKHGIDYGTHASYGFVEKGAK